MKGVLLRDPENYVFFFVLNGEVGQVNNRKITRESKIH